MTQEEMRLSESESRRSTGSAGDPISASAHGARCAKTTAAGTPGNTSPTTTLVRAPTAGTKTAWPASATGKQNHLFRARAMERAGPDPEGTHFRPDRHRRQSRRGRQGVLLLPGLHAHALLHEVPLQVPAGGVSLQPTGGREPAAREDTSRSSNSLDTGVFNDDRYFDVFVEYAKADAEDILIRITVANRGPEAANLRLLPTVWFRNTWSWGGGERRPELHLARRLRDPVIELNQDQPGQSLAAL